jgi:hypothetical protein
LAKSLSAKIAGDPSKDGSPAFPFLFAHFFGINLFYLPKLQVFCKNFVASASCGRYNIEIERILK